MEAGQRRHNGAKTLKSKRGTQGASKSYKPLQHAMTNDNETIAVESTHSLLLSSLKYWEVQRDLIEERIAALRRRPVL